MNTSFRVPNVLDVLFKYAGARLCIVFKRFGRRLAAKSGRVEDRRGDFARLNWPHLTGRQLLRLLCFRQPSWSPHVSVGNHVCRALGREFLWRQTPRT
jgi:hypothetical protein